jgi:hypothetical protein
MYAQYAHPLRENPITDGIGKTLHIRPSPTKGSQWKSLRVGRDPVQESLKFLEKLVTEVFLSLIIPSASIVDLLLNGAVVGKPHGQRRLAKCVINS